MITNIDAQLEDLLCDLAPYWDETQWQRTYLIGLIFKDPLKFFDGGVRLLRQLRHGPKDALSGRMPPEARKVLEDLLGEPSEKQKQVRADLLGDFSIHLIAERLVARHPDFDFANIRKLHESRRTDRLKLTTKQFFALALTVTAFIGKVIPDVVIDDFGWTKAQFERWVFYGTCGLLLYVGFLVFVEWQGVRSDIEKHEFFARILAYLELSAPKPKAEQPKADVEE